MPIIKRFGWLPLWLAGLVLVFAAANKNDPYLIALRGPGHIALAIGSVVAVVALVRRGIWRHGVTARALLSPTR
jgi:beta-N-acetylhexosaminidase